MRKNIFRAALISMAMLSACETVEPQDNQIDDQVQKPGELLFTAKIGSDTKTYLEWDEMSQVYKTRWIDGDSFYLIDATSPTLSYEVCNLVEGSETSTGTFTGSLESSSYVALYAYGGGWDGNVLSVSLPKTQYHFSYSNRSDKKSFKNQAYPMVAMSDTRDLEFYNLCSVLKFSVTGNGEFLKEIVIRSNDDECMSGSGAVSFNGGVPTMEMIDGYASLSYQVHENLYSDPLECYIVLPSQTYDNGFTIEFYTDLGSMDVTTGENIILEQSKLHEIKEPIQYETETYNWILSAYNGDHWMTYENGMYVLYGEYLDYSPYFYNPGTSERLYLSSEYGISYYPMNTRVNLQSEQYDAMLPTWGNMNVYLDPVNKTAYFMSSGWYPSELPSQEDIYQPNFSSLWNVEDGQYIMTSGVVMAKCARGFILAMGYSMDNSVLVYDSEWRYDFPLGCLADAYVQKTTYRGLPELIVDSNTWMYSWNRRNADYYEVIVDLTPPSDFASYSAEKYECVRYTGTLVQEGSKYYVYVDGIDGRRGEIFFPIQDLSAYVGKKVTVEGYFLGFTRQGDLCTMMTSVYIDAESDGVTEDFFLGDDIQM